MRFPLLFVPLLAALVHSAEPTEGVADGVRIVRAQAMDEKIAGTPPSPGGRGGVIVQDEGYRVHVAERESAGLAERHEADTDVWYVLAGRATLVTGGALVEPSTTGPGEQRAASIRGGRETTVGEGDLVTIRPGVPHWVKAVDGRLRYLTVKVYGPAAQSR